MLPPERTHVVTSVLELKALSHELRQRLLEQFCGEPLTAKQAAKALGEPPTKLYHHVACLEAAGLIRLVETRPNRGTTEHYFQANAQAFRIGDRLLGNPLHMGSETKGEPPEAMNAEDATRRAVLFEVKMHLDDQELQLFQEKLSEFIAFFAGPPSPGARAATVVLYGAS
ncbi:MAG: helix-turn-helix transcriptional regulator [Armatimonadetes bacterium]|nr:helix-turn-helix transcriptional regulator [Armatimonadota bacterium]